MMHSSDLGHFSWIHFYLNVFILLQLHTADIGGQGTTSEVVQSVMKIIQSKGQLTAEL